MLQEPARIGRHDLRQQRRAHHLSQTLAEDHVLQQRGFRETADAFEHIAAHEEGMVAIVDARQPALQVVAGRDQPQPPVRIGKTVPESARLQAAPGGSFQREDGTGRQPRVDMQEQQQVALGGGRAGIHLSAASLGRQDTPHPRSLVGHFVAAIRAAAINDDDFKQPLLLQQVTKRLREDLGFVEYRDNHGDHDE